jgi:hypothetical protein
VWFKRKRSPNSHDHFQSEIDSIKSHENLSYQELELKYLHIRVDLLNYIVEVGETPNTNSGVVARGIGLALEHCPELLEKEEIKSLVRKCQTPDSIKFNL